jgi:hypothetical protein
MAHKEKKEKRSIFIDVEDVTSKEATVVWDPPVTVLKKDIEKYEVCNHPINHK